MHTLKIYFYIMHMCVYVCFVCACECIYLRRPETLGPHGAGVIGGFDPYPTSTGYREPDLGPLLEKHAL